MVVEWHCKKITNLSFGKILNQLEVSTIEHFRFIYLCNYKLLNWKWPLRNKEVSTIQQFRFIYLCNYNLLLKVTITEEIFNKSVSLLYTLRRQYLLRISSIEKFFIFFIL